MLAFHVIITTLVFMNVSRIHYMVQLHCLDLYLEEYIVNISSDSGIP